MTKRTLSFSIILVLAILLSIWLIRFATQTTPTVAQNRSDTPDAFMVNAVYQRFNEDGKLHSIISVPKMVHYPARDQSEFTQPNMIFYDENGAPWYISSQFGQSQFGSKKVHLWENVKIHQLPSATNHEMTITTSSLIIYPDERIADTNQSITIIQPGMIVNSVGLHADLKNSRIELISKAHINYQPEAAQ